MDNQAWSWVLGLVGVGGFILAGKKIWWAWYINIAAQFIWAAYAIITDQLGFLVSAGVYTLVFVKNAISWTKEHRKKKALNQYAVNDVKQVEELYKPRPRQASKSFDTAVAVANDLKTGQTLQYHVTHNVDINNDQQHFCHNCHILITPGSTEAVAQCPSVVVVTPEIDLEANKVVWRGETHPGIFFGNGSTAVDVEEVSTAESVTEEAPIEKPKAELIDDAEFNLQWDRTHSLKRLNDELDDIFWCTRCGIDTRVSDYALEDRCKGGALTHHYLLRRSTENYAIEKWREAY